MIKKTCPNGHVYDQSIYGDTCPLCPSSTDTGSNVVPNMAGNPNPTMVDYQESVPQGSHTRLVSPSMNPNVAPAGFSNMQGAKDPTGSTRVSPSIKQQAQEMAQQQSQQRKTVIRHNPAMMGGMKPNEDGRKLVGFLVTYNHIPMGKAFNIYEGRNVIGRDASCDISVPDDNQMSGKHMSIRYLSGNNKFRFHDEMSSNGTYVNKELLDDGELQNYDIIRVGSTLFIFMAIPQI